MKHIYENRVGGHNLQAVSNSLAAQSHADKFRVTLEDNRAGTIVQRKLVNALLAGRLQSPKITYTESLIGGANKPGNTGLTGPAIIQKKPFLNNCAIVQFGRRPGWKKPAREAIKRAKTKKRKFDLAHRYPLKKIKHTVLSGDHRRIRSMVRAITIPRRDFGYLQKGNKTFYNEVMKIVKEFRGDSSLGPHLIATLNSSLINLRPGDPSINRSIGGRLDLRRDDDGYLSDQSQAILDHHQGNDTDQEGEDEIRDSTNFDKVEMGSYESGYK